MEAPLQLIVSRKIREVSQILRVEQPSAKPTSKEVLKKYKKRSWQFNSYYQKGHYKMYDPTRRDEALKGLVKSPNGFGDMGSS